MFSARASLIFKTTQVTRFWDAKRRALVYLVYTDRIIEGSPRNSISVVPVGVLPNRPSRSDTPASDGSRRVPRA